jgi:hypothetical protein
MDKLHALPGAALLVLDDALDAIARANTCTTMEDARSHLAHAVSSINAVIEQAIAATEEINGK